MTLINCLIIMLLVIVTNAVTLILGMRYGAKQLGKMIVEDTNAEWRERGQFRRFDGISKTVGEYVISDGDDAKAILLTLNECADKYGFVSLSDYYDLIKVTSHFSDNNYGWSKSAISEARINHSSYGYIIKFPPVEALF